MGNVDVLRQGYSAFAQGDLEGATEHFHEEIRWENPNAKQIPNPGVHEGKDEVKRILSETPEYWESFSVEPDEFHESGDTVIVLGHVEAKAKATGSEVKVPYVHIWRFENGEARRFQNLFDTALVAEALGS